MPGSTLTVRTLALATVALVLACGHAVKAMEAQRAAADKAVAKVAPSVAPIRVVPAGSGHSTVATYSNNSSGGSRGGSTVATFTSRAGSSSNSVVTFTGDRTVQEKPVSTTASRPHPQPTRKPGILAPKSDPPVVAVRRAGPEPETPIADEPFVGPPAPVEAPVAVVTKPAPQIRNAFAGLGSRSAVEPSGASLVYAHASPK